MELIKVWIKWEDRVGWIPTFVTYHFAVFSFIIIIF